MPPKSCTSLNETHLMMRDTSVSYRIGPVTVSLNRLSVEYFVSLQDRLRLSCSKHHSHFIDGTFIDDSPLPNSFALALKAYGTPLVLDSSRATITCYQKFAAQLIGPPDGATPSDTDCSQLGGTLVVALLRAQVCKLEEDGECPHYGRRERCLILMLTTPAGPVGAPSSSATAVK